MTHQAAYGPERLPLAGRNGEKKQKNVRYIKAIYTVLVVLMLLYFALFPLNIVTVKQIIGDLLLLAFLIAAPALLILDVLKGEELLLSLAILPCIILSAAVSDAKVGVMQLIKIAGLFVGFLFFLNAIHTFSMSEKMKKFLVFANLATCVLLTVYSQMDFAYDSASGNLTLGFSNSNQTAMVLLYCFAMNIMAMKRRDYPWLVGVLVVADLLYLLYLTTSRSCFFTALLLLVLSFLPVKKIPGWVMLLAMVFPLICLFVLPWLYEQGLFLDFELFGKTIYSGRETIFAVRIQYLHNPLQILFGNMVRGNFDNHHNGPLALLLSVGVTGLLVTYHSIYLCMRRITAQIRNPANFTAIFAVLCLFIHSSAEAALMTGRSPFNVMILTILLFAKESACNEDPPCELHRSGQHG